MAMNVKVTGDDGDGVELSLCDGGLMLTALDSETYEETAVILDTQAALLLANSIWDLMSEDNE